MAMVGLVARVAGCKVLKSIAILTLTCTALAQSPDVHPLTGRRIATVMSHLGAEWLDRPERVAEEDPDKAIAALAIQAGATVAISDPVEPEMPETRQSEPSST